MRAIALPLSRELVEDLAMEPRYSQCSVTFPSLEHVVRTCPMASYYAIELMNEGTIEHLPAFVREHDLAENLPITRDWFPRYSRAKSGLVLRVMFIGAPFDQPFNCTAWQLQGLIGSNMVDEFTVAIKSLLYELECDGVLAISLPHTPTIRAPWFAADYLPETKLSLHSKDLQGFLGGLGRSSRQSFRRKLRSIDRSSITIAAEAPSTETLQACFGLYINSYRQSSLRWIEMPSSFFSVSQWTERCHLIRASADGFPIGFALLASEANVGANFRMGLEHSNPLAAVAYQGLYLETIQLAIERGWHQLALGPLSYEIKARLGATIVPRSIIGFFSDPELNDHVRAEYPMIAQQLHGAGRAGH